PFIVLAAFEHPIIRPERPEEAHLELAFARFTRRTRTPLRHTLLAVGIIASVHHLDQAVVAKRIISRCALVTYIESSYLQRQILHKPYINRTIDVYARLLQ